MEMNWCDASCGIKILSGLGEPTRAFDAEKTGYTNKELTFAAFAKQFNPNTYGRFTKGYGYLFSDNKVNGNGERIAAWIKEFDLGELIERGWHTNPNSKREINVWLWTYNGKTPTKATTDEKAKPKFAVKSA